MSCASGRICSEPGVPGAPLTGLTTAEVRAHQGTIFAISPVGDITHTFTSEELEEFAAHYAAADDPENHLTVEQALARYIQRVRRHG